MQLGEVISARKKAARKQEARHPSMPALTLSRCLLEEPAACSSCSSMVSTCGASACTALLGCSQQAEGSEVKHGVPITQAHLPGLPSIGVHARRFGMWDGLARDEHQVACSGRSRT
jgi:hypothetical protein